MTGGTLQLGHASALGHNTGPVTVNSGTLDLHGFSPTIGALNGSGGTVRSNVAGAVALTVGNGGGSGSYGGVVANGSGTVSLIKTGAGSQTVSGNNSYSGGTTVNAGTLIVGHVNGLGTGGLTINSTSTARATSRFDRAGAVAQPDDRRRNESDGHVGYYRQQHDRAQRQSRDVDRARSKAA